MFTRIKLNYLVAVVVVDNVVVGSQGRQETKIFGPKMMIRIKTGS